ncbi:hypothetical protein DSECCO2_308330 [anaerobic digester metagenome]|jgi:heme oxygenase
MENDLFNLTLLKKHSKKFKLTPSKHDLLKEYINKVEKDEFKSETKNYLYFYDVILKSILGYKREDVLFDEKGDVGTGRSEFVLKSDDKKFMVIELKGQGIDLDKRQSGRSDNKSPVEQAFGYAINTGDVNWIMVSNYNEIRLYNYYEKTKYISFNARELLDKQKFACFMLAFSRESHIESDDISKVHEGTLVVDRKLASEFYKLYNETRLMLIKELESESQMERLDAIHYAQVILNRYMFICFAEDTNLLPSQISIDTVATPIQKGNLRHRSIWQRLNELYLDINEGNEFKKISEYNGGLFAEDLDFIMIRDIVDEQNFFKDVYQDWNFTEYEKDINHLLGNAKDRVNSIYRNMLTISSFDFSTELDVNILGHIFENSIGDIEELKEDSKGRRKKEGIFYTPNYITDYICRNTIIPYLSKSGKVISVDELIKEYSDGNEINDLESGVMNIKIVDPACGSGAFLNKAADVLLEIHKGIYDFKKGKYTTTIKTRGGKGKSRVKRDAKHVKLDSYFDEVNTRREILINNIYGVDLNEESVDITKLSLFLKVCQKDRKLPEIDNNIKCGNSLIHDPKYTDKPFQWETEFPEIFKADGFDVVIGNPPYVRHEKIKEIKPYLKDHFKTYTGLADLYVYFFEKGLGILKDKGMLAYISSNKFITANYGKPLRKFILNEVEFESYIDHSSDKVFDDATVHSCVIVLKKEIPNENMVLIDDSFEIQQSRLGIDNWCFENPTILDLRDRIGRKGIKIKDFEDLKIYYGMKTGLMKAFVIDEETRNHLITEEEKNKEIIKPFIRGKDLKKWKIDYRNLYLLYIPWKFPIDNYNSIRNHLLKFKDDLIKRPEVKTGRVDWFALSRYASDYSHEFEKEKIIWAEIAPEPRFCIDGAKLYCETSCFIMVKPKKYDLRYLASLLNSNLLLWIFKQISPQIEGKRLRYKKQYVEQLPIYPATTEEQRPFIQNASRMLQFNQELQKEINGFKNWIMGEFGVEKFSQKLEKYYELSADQFISELSKKKVDTKSRKNREYLEREFSESLAIIKPLLQEIEQTDNEIDQMVYKLYGLNDEEIIIIEDSLS